MNNYKDTGRVYTLQDLFDLGLKLEPRDVVSTPKLSFIHINKGNITNWNIPIEKDSLVKLVGSKQLDEYLEKKAMNNGNIAVTEQEDEAFKAVKTCVKDWKRGDMCIYEGSMAVVVGWHPHHPMVVIDSDEFGLSGAALNELTEPETPEQKAERDELAKNLFLDLSPNGFNQGDWEYHKKFSSMSDIAFKLVDLGYRKETNND